MDATSEDDLLSMGRLIVSILVVRVVGMMFTFVLPGWPRLLLTCGQRAVPLASSVKTGRIWFGT